jgi:polysaccharide pyruvyl transferase WcaK-like protein
MGHKTSSAVKPLSVFTASWGQLHGRKSNMGDIIIFEAVIDILRALLPGNHIYCYSSDPEYTDPRYRVRSSNPLTASGLLKTIRNIYRSNIVLLGGGELVQTRSSFLYLVANLAPGLLSWIFRKKCLAIGAGIADEQEISRFGKYISRFVLNRIDSIGVREQSSYENALAIGIKREKLVLTADLAFHFAGLKRSTTTSTGAPTILLSPRFTKKRNGAFLPAWIKRKLGAKGHEEDFQASAMWFADLLKALCRSHRVIILPVYQGSDTSSEDDLFALTIFEAAGMPGNVNVYDGPMTAASIRDLMAAIDAAVAVPLHAITMAAAAQKPVIALPYASKCANLMTELSLDQCIAKRAGERDDFDISWIQDALRKFVHREPRSPIPPGPSLDHLVRRHDKTVSLIKAAIHHEGLA